MTTYVPQTKLKGQWIGSKRFEYRGEAEALLAARMHGEWRIVESPEPPSYFWDFTQDCAFQRSRGFKHSPMTLARLEKI